ncbi:GspE/PulE family protein [Hydrogenophaga sp. BPS33]|uniref:GspE/PulE family protein n=1 Tax=Hydrogenophaga sp. BPS33 TaxID=2651974 RepID=UPI00131F73D3|nr:GspE/PulE family protein [Hydrogenophaga sp. BPS33]QHE86652.1 type II/IV secretion system protein [Hydrogenophaga sp. BPS33]
MNHCAPDAATLAQALTDVRGGASTMAGKGVADLMADLMERLACTEEALQWALRRHQGIAVLSDAELAACMAGAVRLPCDPPGWRLTVDRQTFLLFDDPWSDVATQSLARSAQARLALARSGHMQMLLQQAGRSGSGKPPAAAGAIGHGGQSPVVAFVGAAIERAYAEGASDIHFETDRHGVSVKFRLDGVMSPGDRLADAQRAEEVISRIKVMAHLDITERRRPQDGRIHWPPSDGGDAVDLRVSIMPSIFGEDAVLRLLDKAQLRHSQSGVSLDLLGFEPEAAGRIRQLARHPHGMLLITGPTGSGKTTTVYAALTEVNDGLEKIITIEDPVEYELPGVLQIPVNEQKGLTFASGLRSILRHDPDKILVGEIRDAETAQIAVQSSLTGHLVFTTVHANSLFDVLGRFQHFGIEPFALASALNGVVVQRLLRQVCPHCLAWRSATQEEAQRLEAVGLPVPLALPAPAGCAHCRQTGYRGRFVVAEVHVLSDVVRDLMVARASMTAFKQAVYRQEADRLLVQALDLVRRGRTTLEEVSRVVGLA